MERASIVSSGFCRTAKSIQHTKGAYADRAEVYEGRSLGSGWGLIHQSEATCPAPVAGMRKWSTASASSGEAAPIKTLELTEYIIWVNSNGDGTKDFTRSDPCSVH